MPENADNFCCDICDFICSKQSNYAKHLMTRKHKNTSKILTNTYILASKNAENAENVENVDNSEISNNIVCECGKEYKHRQSLWNHKKKCKQQMLKTKFYSETKSETDSDAESDIESNKKMSLLKKDNLIEYLIKENSEFKGLIMELVKKDNTNVVNNNINNNCNNVNNSFNLNLFLNEKCKDAINISDFVDNVKMQLSDLENFGHLGYVEGVSRILIKNLKDLDTYSRPIHCSDLKREVLYIKDNNEWTKETEEKLVIKNAIKQVANKNIKQIQTWKQENPECTESESKKNDQYMNIVMNSMSGGTSEEQFNNISQIIKNVSKEVIINK